MIPLSFLQNCSRQIRTINALSCLSRSFTKITDAQNYDVVIVGAGMVGAALAALLSSQPLTSALRIALIDAKVPADKLALPLPTVPDIRVSTLTPASAKLVQNCGAWQFLRPPNSADIKDMQVWDYNSSGCLRWSASQVGHSDMGVIAENSLIQSAFIKALEKKDNVDLLFPAKITTIKLPVCLKKGEFLDTQSAIVNLATGQSLTAKLVVGADGAFSRVRQLSGLHSSGHDYGQKGLVATVETSEITHTAYQKFLPTGPFALLPVRNGFSNVVWSTTSKMAEAVEAADLKSATHAFNEALSGGPSQQSILSKLIPSSQGFQHPPQITNVVGGKPKSFPLRRQFAPNFVSSRLALVGDAYRVVHPLAGQGVNLGLGDVHQLSLALSKAISSGQDIGNLILLRNEYESPRRMESRVMMTALDTIRELFGVQISTFQKLRGLGMETLNHISPLKNEIMLYAMGLKPAAAHLPFLD